MSNEKKLRIRNNTAEFLIFSRQAGENSIEVRIEDETVWLTQKLIGVLFEKGRSTAENRPDERPAEEQKGRSSR